MNLVVYFRWPYCGTVTQSIYYAYFTSYLSSKLTYSFFFAAGFNSFASRSAKLSPLLSNYQNPTVIFDWYGVATEAVIGAVSRAGRQSHRLQDGERGIPLILHTLYGNTTEYFSDLPSTLPIIKKKTIRMEMAKSFSSPSDAGLVDWRTVLSLPRWRSRQVADSFRVVHTMSLYRFLATVSEADRTANSNAIERKGV